MLDPQVLLAGLVTTGSGLGVERYVLEVANGLTASSDGADPGLSSRAPWHLGKRLRREQPDYLHMDSETYFEVHFL